MKKWTKHSLLSIALTLFILPSQAFAAYSLEDNIPRPDNAVKAETTADGLNKITFTQQGIPVFASNAPETLWDGNRPDGSGIVQVNKTLYRDRLTGNFRFWSVHANATAKPVKFYMVVKNTASSAVKLYVKRQAYASGSGDPTIPARDATQAFMRQPMDKGAALLATIAPGKAYVHPYSTEVKPHQSMDFIADLRAVNAKTGRDETVTVSDVVTNNGPEKVAAYAESAEIAQTNWTDSTTDDYRGLLKTSARKVEVHLQLTDDAPAKFMNIANGEPFAYPNEQEPLMTSWDLNGKPLKAPEAVVFGQKKRGAYWWMDLTYVIHIQNLTKSPAVYTLYGAAPNMKASGVINYQIDTLAARSFKSGTTFVINDKQDYTLYTMVEPFLSVPLGLYFIAE